MLAEHTNEPVDIFKVVKMVLIHDIVEIDAGDTFIYNTLKNHVSTDEERLAALRIFGLLAEKQAQGLMVLWEGFEEGITAEARFARTVDRLEPLLQNTSNAGGTWKEFNVSYEKVYEKKRVIKDSSENLWNYAKELIDNSVATGILKKE